MTTWGLCATIRAPRDEILHFAAWHLEAGAHRLYLYLDDDNQAAFEALKPHPKMRVTLCDGTWWNGDRPETHQSRQVRNAIHAYHQRAETDWLIHIDVDEFLVSDQPVADILSSISQQDSVTRIRPMEKLSGPGNAFKAFIPNGPARTRILNDLYPTFGLYLNGGFLSHIAGKVFVRTGLPDILPRIHNVFQKGKVLRACEDQPGIALAHCHAKTWEDWRAAYDYRFEHGSYRASLKPNRRRGKGGLTTHEVLELITNENGEAGLRAFFDEVSADTPALRDRLTRHGLLRHANLDLKDTIYAHFPWISR
jgi:hypothetical protein